METIKAVTEGRGGAVTGTVAVAACAAMAVSYEEVLYAPTVILRLPPAGSVDSYMIRRFVCVSISTAASVIFSASLLGIWRLGDLEVKLSIYGLRRDHMWQAAAFPLILASLLYAGSLISKIYLLASRWEEVSSHCYFQKLVDWICRLVYNVMAWRNYVVAPFTEELVFRACMIPLLLCGGFKTYNIIIFSPVFFSLGNLVSPVVAHIFCNIMGLPVLSSSRTKDVLSFSKRFPDYAVWRPSHLLLVWFVSYGFFPSLKSRFVQ